MWIIEHAEIMSKLVTRSGELLLGMLDESRALFSYSATLRDGRIVNDFDHPLRIRYTVNSLAGLQRAVASGDVQWDLAGNLENFLRLHLGEVTNPGDLGLLLSVLAVQQHDASDAVFRKMLDASPTNGRSTGLPLQEVAWILSGMAAYARHAKSNDAADAARTLFRHISDKYADHASGLACADDSSARRRFVSFGGTAYFVKSLYDYHDAFGDEEARARARASTLRVIALQGPRGEWPWFIDARRATVLDWYQVYTVHQSSMSMLFLLPALDAGLEEARSAIERSYRWIFGENELHAPMAQREPFFTYRSIRRKQKWERARRYGRSLALSAFHARAAHADPSTLTVNRECRSYELGWILYCWSGRNDFVDFTGLQLLPGR